MGCAVDYAVRMKNITKYFGKAAANRGINLDLENGEILALLGENGSGKTTLMNILSGIYFPDSGTVEVRGRNAIIRSPQDAAALGIGMIHQHFKLVDVLTAAENIVLGLPGSKFLDRKQINREVREAGERYQFQVDPGKKVYQMSVSEKQAVEILKVLYRGASILILDEPTAVLAPQETDKLFAVLRNMKADGKSIIIITHKLHEVLAISDRVAVLRKGECIGTVETASADQRKLTEMMVGRQISLSIGHPCARRGEEMLRAEDLSCLGPCKEKVLDGVSFSAYGGEILGIAGIAGSGQKELCEAIAGLYPVCGGSIFYRCQQSIRKKDGARSMENIVGQRSDQIFRKGIALAFVPEDRLGMGLIPSMDMVDNVMLRSYRENPGILVNRRKPRKLAEKLVEELEIATPGVSMPVGRLSGGNVQKVLLGREIAYSPSVLIAAYPARGLDIHSSYKIYGLLNGQKEKGVAVIFVGEDLDVLMEISDRILVLCGGKASGVVDARETTKEELGLMMLQAGREMPREEADL